MTFSEIQKSSWCFCPCGDENCTGFSFNITSPLIGPSDAEDKLHAVHCHGCNIIGARFNRAGVRVVLFGDSHEEREEIESDDPDHQRNRTEKFLSGEYALQVISEWIRIRNLQAKWLFANLDKVREVTGFNGKIEDLDDVVTMMREEKYWKRLLPLLDNNYDEVMEPNEKESIEVLNMPSGMTGKAISYKTGEWVDLDNTLSGDIGPDPLGILQQEEQRRLLKAIKGMGLEFGAVEVTPPFDSTAYPSTTAYGDTWSIRVGSATLMQKMQVVCVPREMKEALAFLFFERWTYIANGEFRGQPELVECLEIYPPDIWKTRELVMALSMALNRPKVEEDDE